VIAFASTRVTLDPNEPNFGIGTVMGWPCDGPISTRYGVRDGLHPLGHAGDDIAAQAGTPIFLPAAGLVVDAFCMPLRGNEWDARKTIYGNAVIIDHGDVYTIYMHMRDNPVVREGQRLEAGALIGYVGSTGFSTGPHLHWGMWPKPLRYPDFGSDGPVGTLLDPFDYCAQASPEPSAPAINPEMALTFLRTAEVNIAAAKALLGG